MTTVIDAVLQCILWSIRRCWNTIKNKKKENTFWNFELLLPIRNSEFQDDIDALKAIGADVTEPLPVAFSIGYHWKF